MRSLAQLAALFGRLDAVADGVADQMRQRLGDGVENSFVEIGVLPADVEFHFAPALPRHIAHHAREAAEQLVDGHHADLHHRALQIVQHPRLERHGVGELAAQQLFRIALGELVQRLLQHRLADNQFAHQVQHVVDAAGFDPQQIFLHRGNSRCRVASGRRCSGVLAADCEDCLRRLSRAPLPARDRFLLAMFAAPRLGASISSTVTSSEMVGIWPLA